MELQANNDAMNRAQENKIILDNSLHVAEAMVTTLTHAVATGTPAPPEVIASAGPTAVKPALPPRRSQVLSNELAQLRLRYNEQHPDIRKLKEELAAAEEAEAAEDQQAASRLAQRRSPRLRHTRPSRPHQIQSGRCHRIEQSTGTCSRAQNTDRRHGKELASRSAEQERIRRDITLYQSRIEQLPVREQEIADLMRDYDITKGTYQSLMGKKVSPNG